MEKKENHLFMIHTAKWINGKIGYEPTKTKVSLNKETIRTASQLTKRSLARVFLKQRRRLRKLPILGVDIQNSSTQHSKSCGADRGAAMLSHESI